MCLHVCVCAENEDIKGRLIGRFTSVWADGVADKTADEVQWEMQRAIEENV